MNSSVANFYWRIIGQIYGNIFHEKVSDEVANFLKNISYMGFGTFISTIFAFTFNILSGRLLGPIEYGKFVLVQSIAMFLYIPMLMGINNSMVKYTSESDVFNRQRNIISTTYILVSVFTIGSTFAYLLIPQKILVNFSISKEVLKMSIAFAVLFVFYTLTTNTLRGLHNVKKYATFVPLYNLVLLFVFLSFAFMKFTSYRSVIFSMILAYMITGGIILINIRKYIMYKINKFWICRLTNYGIYTIIGSIAFVIYTNIDQIVINKFMSTEDVGIYKAYCFSSINVASIIFGIFSNVFIPVASKYRDKTIFFKKIDKITPYLIGFGIPVIIFIEFVILNLYGGAYPIDFSLMILFAIVSILVGYYGIHDWTYSSEGITGVKLVSKSSLLIAIVNLFLDIYLIPRLGLFGAIISTAIALIIGICFLLKKGKLLLSPNCTNDS